MHFSAGRFSLLIGAFVLTLTTAQDVAACGGILCRLCRHHHSQWYSSAYAQQPQMYVLQGTMQSSNNVQNFGISDVVTILDLVNKLRGQSGSDCGSSSSSSSSSEFSDRINQLQRAVEQNSSGIAELVRSESDLANRVQTEIDGLARRIDEVERRLPRNAGASLAGENQTADITQAVMSQVQDMLDDKLDRRDYFALKRRAEDEHDEITELKEAIKTMPEATEAEKLTKTLTQFSLSQKEAAHKRLTERIKERKEQLGISDEDDKKGK